MRTGHVAAVRPRKELVTFQLIELHSVPRQLGPDCRLPKLAGSTAGGEMILQPCQPLVPNPLTARRSTTAAFFGGSIPHRHDANASSRTLACFRSSVSK